MRMLVATAAITMLAINLQAQNIGIGTLTPIRKLEVANGDIRIQRNTTGSRFMEFLSTVTGQNDVRFEYSSAGSYLYVSSSTNDFAAFIDKTRIELAAAPTYVFTVYGSALASSGTWTASDMKLKQNIADIESATSLVKAMKPKTYYFKKDDFSNLRLPDTKQYGLLAQDLELILPDLVQTSQEPVRVNASGEREMEELKSINYNGLVPVLIKAIQELQQEVDALKAKLNSFTKGQ